MTVLLKANNKIHSVKRYSFRFNVDGNHKYLRVVKINFPSLQIVKYSISNLNILFHILTAQFIMINKQRELNVLTKPFQNNSIVTTSIVEFSHNLTHRPNFNQKYK